MGLCIIHSYELDSECTFLISLWLSRSPFFPPVCVCGGPHTENHNSMQGFIRETAFRLKYQEAVQWVHTDEYTHCIPFLFDSQEARSQTFKLSCVFSFSLLLFKAEFALILLFILFWLLNIALISHLFIFFLICVCVEQSTDMNK